jgi:hypothetical protein
MSVSDSENSVKQVAGAGVRSRILDGFWLLATGFRLSATKTRPLTIHRLCR